MLIIYHNFYQSLSALHSPPPIAPTPLLIPDRFLIVITISADYFVHLHEEEHIHIKRYIFHQLIFHMLGMSKEAYGENGDMLVVPAVEERCKSFGTISIPSISIILKADYLFRKFSSSSTNSQGETLS